MFAFLFLAGALMAQAAPAAPEAAAPAKPAPPTPVYAPPKAADQKDDQIVCHSQSVLGSRLPVRRCRTVGEIKERTFNDQQMVEHAQQNLQIRSN